MTMIIISQKQADMFMSRGQVVEPDPDTRARNRKPATFTGRCHYCGAYVPRPGYSCAVCLTIA